MRQMLFSASSDALVEEKSAEAKQEGKRRQRKPWERKRKIWVFAIGGAVGLVVVAAAVAVSIAVVRSRKPAAVTPDAGRASTSNVGTGTTSESGASSSTSNTSYQSLYFPQGYNGTGLNGALGGRKANTTYNQLIAFGSSYSDNGHNRSGQYSASNPPEDGYWNHRWSNGPVWVEYLRDHLGNWTQSEGKGSVTHLNYAYGGATTNNSIHPTSSPDTAQQMQWYLTGSDYKPATQKPLVAMFTTTNDITQTFNQYFTRADIAFHNITDVYRLINIAAQSLITQLTNLIPTDPTHFAPDYVILPILPVEMAPQSAWLAGLQNTTVDLIRDITGAYNTALMAGAKNLSTALGSRGTVFTYDVPSWMYAMREHPSLYGLGDKINVSCKSLGGKNPNTYIFWDRLHLVTNLQSQLADIVYNVVLTSP